MIPTAGTQRSAEGISRTSAATTSLTYSQGNGEKPLGRDWQVVPKCHCGRRILALVQIAQPRRSLLPMESWGPTVIELNDIGDFFRRRHFDREVIILCVHWFQQCKLSSCDLVELMSDRGYAQCAYYQPRCAEGNAPEFI